MSDSRRDCLAYASECVRLAGLAHDLQIREELLSLADDYGEGHLSDDVGPTIAALTGAAKPASASPAPLWGFFYNAAECTISRSVSDRTISPHRP